MGIYPSYPWKSISHAYHATVHLKLCFIILVKADESNPQ